MLAVPRPVSVQYQIRPAPSRQLGAASSLPLFTAEDTVTSSAANAQTEGIVAFLWSWGLRASLAAEKRACYAPLKRSQLAGHLRCWHAVRVFRPQLCPKRYQSKTGAIHESGLPFPLPRHENQPQGHSGGSSRARFPRWNLRILVTPHNIGAWEGSQFSTGPRRCPS